MKTIGLALGLAAALASTAFARDLEDILEEKGVINDIESNEAKAAKEKAAAPALPPLPSWVEKVTFSGDVRVRNESFFRKDTADRVRQRFRLRFGAKAAVSKEVELGMRIATGNPDDPISNNQSFDDTFDFKSINVTNAYIKLSPSTTLGFSRPYVVLQGGKFDVPTYHASRIQFDGDLTPEGFFEQIRLLESTSDTVRNLNLNFGQWVFEETSSRGDGAIFAFQGATTMAFGESVLMNFGIGDFQYQKPSLIATKVNSNDELTISNTVLLESGEIVGGRAIDPAEDEDGPVAALVDDFNILNIGGDFAIKTGLPAWPIQVWGDYVLNTEASSDDTGYQFGAGIGASKDPNDLNFRYAYQSLETDAVISAFTDSDFGRDGGTNSEGHILQLNYMMPFKGLQLTSTAFIVEPVDDVDGRNPEREYRWQFDLIAKF